MTAPGQAQRAASAVLLASCLLSAPLGAQEALHGVGDTPAPSAATASPSAVLVIDGEEVLGERYAPWQWAGAAAVMIAIQMGVGVHQRRYRRR